MKLRLVFTKGPLTGQERTFSAPKRVLLGRSSENDVGVSDARASRVHCAIDLRADGVELEDLGSANGTFLNGKKVEKVFLEGGERLTFGDTEATLAIEIDRDAPTSIMTPGRPAGKVLAAFERAMQGPTEVGGYMLGRRLGEGGMGAVYEGRRGGRVVAVKILKPLDSSTADDDRQRFEREGKLAATLDHPNIVKVLERGDSGIVPYIVMELIRGENVKTRVFRDGPLPVAAALEIARQVASALEHARQRNVVHRDVKPENVLLEKDGTAKLTDFGLAKPISATGSGSGPTKIGDVLGTLAFMSPEQVLESKSASHSADIYSLGATLYFMLGAEPPFSAMKPHEFMDAIVLAEPTPLASHREDLPPAVGTLVARCLCKNPADRYATAGELERALADLHRQL